MLDHIEGTLERKSPSMAVVSVGGFGISMTISTAAFDALPSSGKIRVLTHLIVREDDLQIYGFQDEEERRCFRMLLTVQGVGPRMAITILSNVRPERLREMIHKEDDGALRRVKGIGAKLSSRLVTELKTAVSDSAVRTGVSGDGQVMEDVLLALVSLGYTRSRAESTVQKACKRLEGDSNQDAETLLRTALTEV